MIAALVVAFSVFTAAADHARIPVDVLEAICWYETRGEADRRNAQGSLDERGICQVRLSTARQMGYKGTPGGLYEPRANIWYAAKWLADCQRRGADSIRQLAMCYNEGRFTDTSKTPYSARIANTVTTARMKAALHQQVAQR